MLVDDDLEHGLVADPAFLGLVPQLFDDGRSEKNRGRHLPGLGAHDDRSLAPGNVMTQVPRFEFLELRVFIPSPRCLLHTTSARPLASACTRWGVDQHSYIIAVYVEQEKRCHYPGWTPCGGKR